MNPYPVRKNLNNTCVNISPVTRGISMKWTFSIIVLIALLGALVVPASAEGAATVTITDYNVNPPVLMPESLGTVFITIKNTATSATVSEKSGQLSDTTYATVKTTDINVNIENVHLEGNGISVLTSDFDRVGEIGPGQSLAITFSIRAPAKNGMYFPEVWIDTTGGKSTRYPIPVNVNTAVGIQKQAILILDSSMSTTANPGEEIPLTLTVRNAGLTLADDVTVKIENMSTVVAPKNADLYHLGVIGPGEQQTVSLVLISDKQAGSGLIRIPVTLSYNAIDGIPRTQTTGIDLMMKGKSELGFVSVDTSPPRLAENTPFDLTIRIENTGTGEAK